MLSPCPSMTMRTPFSVLPVRTPFTRSAPDALSNRPLTPRRSSASRAGFLSSRIPILPISPSAATWTSAAPSRSVTEIRPSLWAGLLTCWSSSRESTRFGSAPAGAGAAAGAALGSPSVSTRSEPWADTSYFWSSASVTTIRATWVLPSLNCAAFQPAMPPPECPEPAAAVTSPSFTSMTTRGGSASLKAVKSGSAVAWMKSCPPFSSTEVTFTGAAGPAAEAAAISPAARNTWVTIRFSFQVAARTIVPPSRRRGARLPGAP